MPDGKPAGVPCVQLDDAYQCKLFGLPERPAVCGGFQAEPAICGDAREEAIRILSELEAAGPIRQA